ncbi:hypothetical protein PC116_g17098 [Phytophthora cactorum]|uniref:Tyrosine-protein phosphatase domain-containing protein n=1 Tax=Phytophthora cactorum TaxID=29920 RepID=A0A8T1BYG8_9STRA|nr:hypothetical protein PC111_g13048 [Phytophthora cactorum]KAG2817335.1 hypothetical protein PC112_g13094 [Phytophthora cactorum]KAG2853239.1 hypothetical protein PC113_g14325 [Phytophthora cactorum]KAG2896043.1 hypothetical protein PC114_g15264 [Phytophthora cactorum]KAG2909052.1 hypothetical protein PC115_g13393 [Phytophthora cactorum]
MGFIVRRLKVWNDKSGESRVIQHIQLTTWPDHAWRRYKLGQVLIDRTGAGEAMKQAMDIPRVVYSLRSERPGMVQTPVQEQYQMIYQYVAAM